MPYPGSIIDRAIGVLKLDPDPDRWIDGVEMTTLLGLARRDRQVVCKALRRANDEGFLVRRPRNERHFEYQLAPGIDALVANAENSRMAAQRAGGRLSGERRRQKRFDGDGKAGERRQTGPHAQAQQQEAATPDQGASLAVGNVAEPQLGPGPARVERPSSSTLQHRGVG